MHLLSDGPYLAVPTSIVGPVLAVGLMASGMIAAAASGRLWVGVLLACAYGVLTTLIANAAGMLSPLHLLSAGSVILLASFSFAARGALFARSAADKGWWIALFVVAGEAAVLATAATQPGAIPDWLLVLLPAQWASMAIQSALTGSFSLLALAAMAALIGTAAATLLVRSLWPRRWTYLVMFTTWLALSALVYHNV